MPDVSGFSTSVLTRRQGLIALGLVGPLGLLVACTGSDDAGPPSGSAAPTGGTDDVASKAAAEERALIARYDGVLAALPALDAAVVTLLTGIRDEHVQHLEALGGGEAAPSSSEDIASTITADSALRELAQAERQASKSRIRACVASEESELTRLLAFIGASEAAHAPALRKART